MSKPPKPRLQGILLLVCAVGLIVMYVFIVAAEGPFDTNTTAGLSGLVVAAAINGIALLLLPVEKIYRCEESLLNDKRTVTNDFSTLMWIIKMSAVIAGTAVFLILKYLCL
jgi:hypothetical protein